MLNNEKNDFILTINRASLIDILRVHKLYINLSEISKNTYHSRIYGFPNSKMWFLAQICMCLSHTPLRKIWYKLNPKYIYYIFVAKSVNGEVIGFSHFVLHGKDKQGMLKANIGTAVSDKYQGKGIGTALFHELIVNALNAGVDILFLEVVKSNIPAVKLYKKNGFKVVGERSDSKKRVILNMWRILYEG